MKYPDIGQQVGIRRFQIGEFCLQLSQDIPGLGSHCEVSSEDEAADCEQCLQCGEGGRKFRILVHRCRMLHESGPQFEGNRAQPHLTRKLGMAAANLDESPAEDSLIVAEDRQFARVESRHDSIVRFAATLSVLVSILINVLMSGFALEWALDTVEYQG